MEEEETYHYDFTTASELEIFIARVEEIIQDWGLHHKSEEESLKKNDFTKEWYTSSETLTFSEAEFTLYRYYLKLPKLETQNEKNSEESEEAPDQAILDMMNIENDFFSTTNPPIKNAHPIARWYGLRDFLVLIPEHSSSVASESRIKILLSSISIAINNTNCKIPFFLQILEPWQNFFLGVHESECFHTNFNMVHLKRIPLNCKFLTGLLAMFKSKIGMIGNPVIISVQFKYILKDWPITSLTQEPPNLDLFKGDMLYVKGLGSLPFGSTYDTISELHLSAQWPFLLENNVVDGENYSDLDPLQAPVWKVSVTKVDNPSCFLSEYFTEFIVLTKNVHSIRDLLGNFIGSGRNSNLGQEISSSLNVLTESRISAISKAVIKKEVNKHFQQTDQPISVENLMALLYFLFPDADEDSKTPYDENLGGEIPNLTNQERKFSVTDKKFDGMKSAPYDGLLWRLSIVLAHIIHSLGGVQSAAFFWYEFTQELRFRWENGIFIPGLVASAPDSKTCLLNQKLQLLNCCIQGRLKREKQTQKKCEKESESEGDDDEFYDCCDEENLDEDGEKRKTKQAPLDKPIGRLARHDELKLLETGEPLYIPITQDPVPKTEDQVEEDAEVLLKLGSDALGSELRARLMSAYLLSDMEAFKAANPGCILADFIRWCSPRDWIEEENEYDEFGQKKGHLSNRMEIPGNTWKEVWEVARPVPAKWQKRLFDYTKESEKILHFLEKQTPKEFIELLLPVMIVCIIHKLEEEMEIEQLPGLDDVLSKLIKKAEKIGRMPKIDGSSYEELINEISIIETSLAHYKSLKQKFFFGKEEADSEVLEFIKNLLTKGECEVPGGPKSKIGSAVCHHFVEAAKSEELKIDPGYQLTSEKWNVMTPFPSPQEKEMILRLSAAHGPQRLHAIIKKNEFRLCGAFTKNIYLSQ